MIILTGWQKIFVSNRCVAQFGRALRSGRRGRKFKSCRIDTKKDTVRYPFFVSILQLCTCDLCRSKRTVRAQRVRSSSGRPSRSEEHRPSRQARPQVLFLTIGQEAWNLVASTKKNPGNSTFSVVLFFLKYLKLLRFSDVRFCAWQIIYASKHERLTMWAFYYAVFCFFSNQLHYFVLWALSEHRISLFLHCHTWRWYLFTAIHTVPYLALFWLL